MIKKSPASKEQTGSSRRFQNVKAQSPQSSPTVMQPGHHNVYRPQPVPHCLQAKMSVAQQPSTGQTKRSSNPPPVYRPQPVPRVLQAKKPPVQPPVVQSKKAAVAPPIYYPKELKVLQPKRAGGQPQGASKSPARPTAPPVYRPHPTPVVQRLKQKTRGTTHLKPDSLTADRTQNSAPGVQAAQMKQAVRESTGAAGKAMPGHGAKGLPGRPVGAGSNLQTVGSAPHKNLYPRVSRPSSTVQRHITRDGTTNITYGNAIDLALKNASSGELKALIAMCENDTKTHLHFETYYAPKLENGETMIRVTGNDGQKYDLDNPGNVNWSQVSQDSHITITVKINSAFVYGYSESTETILHELDVHATKYVKYIKDMRAAYSKRTLAGLWDRASDSSNNGQWQHDRLGGGRDRALTKDLASVGKAMNDDRLEQAMRTEYMEDVNDH